MARGRGGEAVVAVRRRRQDCTSFGELQSAAWGGGELPTLRGNVELFSVNSVKSSPTRYFFGHFLEKRISRHIFAPQGGLAQLARAFAWHARGHRFEPDILHTRRLFIERRTAVFYRPRRLKRIGAADPKVAQPRNYCGSPYAYTNGYFTTSAFINLSRITTATTVPIAAYSLLTYPKPMPHLSMGDMVPDVTWPISSPSRFASL